jgi:hypothetical protein
MMVMTPDKLAGLYAEIDRLKEVAIQRGAEVCAGCSLVVDPDDGGAKCDCGHCGYVCAQCLRRDSDFVPLSPRCWESLYEEAAGE